MKTKFALLLVLIVLVPCSRVFADDIVPDQTIVLPSVIPTETVLIRNGDTIVYQGTVDLPASGSIAVADSLGGTHSINADSVLGLLYSIQQTSDAFSVSDLQYYASYSSLYLKCITPKNASPLCDSWQYVVNNATPGSGMDTTVLTGGETIGLYFGSPHQVVFDTTSIATNGSFMATAEKYNYADNSWSPLLGVTIGVTVPNPSDQYNPTVVASQTVDAAGSTTFTLTDVGTYMVGISDDYYFPSYTITVTVPVITTGGNTGGGGGGGTGGSGTPPPVFSVSNALAYLESVQSTDGSFAGSDLYTDWAAIAFVAGNAPSGNITSILDYMATHSAVSSIVTDNERHTIALLALEQNPYSFHGTDYIAPIVSAYDGTQFGDPSLVNDDIFALIPLRSAGYTASDAIIAKDVSFILSKQAIDGSWSESPDMTAAAIQALKPLDSITGISAALTNAELYLKNSQSSDGGFGSIYSTSWAAQAMNTLGAAWTHGTNTIPTYLATAQASDGAALPITETLANRVWATSYAIPAALSVPWSVIMHSVSKPATQVVSFGGVGGGASGETVSQKIESPAQTPVVPALNTMIVLSTNETAPVVQESVSEDKIIPAAIQNNSNKKIPVPIETIPSKNEPLPLAAAATKSDTHLPFPLVGGIAVSGIGLAVFARRFFI